MNSISTISLLSLLGNFGEPCSNLRRRKTYKKRVDCFKLPDSDFRKKYRFTKSSVRYIISLVEDEIKLDKRGSGTSPQLQVLVALRCWGRREVQDDTGDLHGLSQSTVSRICARVARALARHANTLIKMPSFISEEETAMREFRKIQNFPGIIGSIDGTHVRIKKTGGEAAQYYINRKGFYSLNVQAVCDAQLKIRDIVARWRGSTHDSRIFNESSLKQRFEDGEFRGRLLGDAGYQLLPYLFTPLSRPQTDKEIRYNKAHIATRNTIERCFGVWKQRFRCLLHGIPVHLENAKVVIVALAVLHNIAVDMKDQVIDDDHDESIIAGHELSLLENGGTESGHTGPVRRRTNYILQNFIERNF